MSGIQRRPAASLRSDSGDVDIERADGPVMSHTTTNATAAEPESKLEELEEEVADRVKYAWNKFRGTGVRLPSLGRSLKNIATHSILNVLFAFLPVAWIGHFLTKTTEDGAVEPVFSPKVQFVVSFLAIIPLEKMFDWLGEEMAIYVGAELGDLLNITLNNSVEAALAIFLLTKDHYRLLQSTIIGVVLLHLLLIPGVAFFTGGARIIEQQLSHHSNELNHSLLTLGVMTLVLPAAFFAALDRGSLADLARVTLDLSGTNSTEVSSEDALLSPLLSDAMRGRFLSISRGLAVLLLFVYICSRFYLHNPPGKGNALQMLKSESEAHMKKALEKEERPPAIGPYVGTVCIVVCVGVMAATAEWLVDSIEDVQDTTAIGPEWFGLFLLPIISFAADGLLAVLFFARKAFFMKAEVPDSVASGLAIDLAIQFLLFWMPFLVLVAWWAHKPLSLLFDFLEIAMLVAAAFLTNYVTADSKTNWVEGFVMVSFYIMIGLVAWYYPGQVEVRAFVGKESVAEALLHVTLE